MIGLRKRIKPQDAQVGCDALPEVAQQYVQGLNDVRSALQESVLKSRKKRLRVLEAQLDKVVQAFQLGYEPTTPPMHWFHGIVEQGKTWAEGVMRHFPSDGEHQPAHLEVRTYTGAMPLAVELAYVRAVPVFGDDIVVYSPYLSDFKRAIPVVRDPVMIGRLKVGSERLFFEVIRWGTPEDLLAK